MEEIIETTKNTKPIQTLKNMSFNGVLEDFNNKLIYLEQMSEGISEEYADEQLFNTEQLVLNSKKLQNKLQEINYKNKINSCKTLQILSHYLPKEILMYPHIEIVSLPSDRPLTKKIINWKIWDNHLNDIKICFNTIKWEQYTQLDILLTMFLWHAGQGPTFYNNFGDKSELNLNQIKQIEGGHLEFFITLEAYIEMDLNIPTKLLKKIMKHTLYFKKHNYVISSIKMMKSINYIDKNSIFLIKRKINPNYDSFNKKEFRHQCHGLKVRNFMNEFINIDKLQIYNTEYINICR